MRIVEAHDVTRTKAFWASIAHWLRSERRLARLGRWCGERVDLLPVGSDFQIERRGEDSRFRDSPLRVPAGVLRDRQQDVLPPQELAKRHAIYRQTNHHGSVVPSRDVGVSRGAALACHVEEPNVVGFALASTALDHVRRNGDCLSIEWSPGRGPKASVAVAGLPSPSSLPTRSPLRQQRS